MTTFTKLESNEQASIAVYPSRKLSKINDNIYGGFTEHMGRCVYGGLYDPGNPNKNLIDENGFRKDVIESFKELNVPVVRYPGGNFVATYHWIDGVGPREKRPKRPELAWRAKSETNEFGTDEFMKWCEAVGTEPFLSLNFGTGTLDEGKLAVCTRVQEARLVAIVSITKNTWSFKLVLTIKQLWHGSNTATQHAIHTTPTSVARTVGKSLTTSSTGHLATSAGVPGRSSK
jgi:hypothetical protein